MEFLGDYNLIDLFILGTLAITVILGVWKGFIRSLTALASLVVGVYLAMTYYPRVEPYLGKISSLDPNISMIISMVIIFIVVQGLFVLLRHVLAALIDLIKLGWLDHILGALMGLVAGFVLVAVAVEVMLLGIPEWPMVKQAKLVPPVHELTVKAMNFAPEGLKKQFRLLIDKWKGTQGAEPSKPGAGTLPPKGSPAAPPRTAK